MSLRIAPNIALCRYFGTMTTWYREYHFTWDWPVTLCGTNRIADIASGRRILFGDRGSIVCECRHWQQHDAGAEQRNGTESIELHDTLL